MKILMTIMSLVTVSSTVFAAQPFISTDIRACLATSSKYKTCTTKVTNNEGQVIYGFEVVVKNLTLNIQSDQSYAGVDAAALTAGLQKPQSSSIAAFIAGPVVFAINEYLADPSDENDIELAEVKARLAKRIAGSSAQSVQSAQQEATYELIAAVKCPCKASLLVKGADGKSGYVLNEQKVSSVKVRVQNKEVVLQYPPEGIRAYYAGAQKHEYVIAELAKQGITLGANDSVGLISFTGTLSLYEDSEGTKPVQN